MNKKTDTININQLITALLNKIVPILLCTALCASAAFIYYSVFAPEKYTATVSIIVDNRSTRDTADENTTQIKSTSDITAARMLADTYIAIFNNTSFLESVAKTVNETSSVIADGSASPLNGTQIGKMLTMSSVNDTEVLQINASTTDPQLSVDICYAIVAQAQTVLRESMNTLTVNSVEGDNILLPTIPSSPDVMNKTFFATLLGFLVSCAAVAAIYILDDTIKVTDDVSKICGYPVIGEIPSIKTEATQKIRRVR